MTREIKTFVISSGIILIAMALWRLYFLLLDRANDQYFTPHLLVTILSIIIGGAILRVGIIGYKATRRNALSLIRNGSIISMIWGYRLYLILRTVEGRLLRSHLYLAIIYITLGLLVMSAGLKVSRKLKEVRSSNLT